MPEVAAQLLVTCASTDDHLGTSHDSRYVHVHVYLRSYRLESRRDLRRPHRFIGMFSSKRLEGWTAVFLFTTVLTSVTGFFFPVDRILPSHIVGVLSLVVLAVTLAGLYIYRLAGAWRWLYVATAVSLLPECLRRRRAGVRKVPFLNALAPTQKDLPFVVAQGVVLLSLSTSVSRRAIFSSRGHRRRRALETSSDDPSHVRAGCSCTRN